MTWKAIPTRDLPRHAHREAKITVRLFGELVLIRGVLRGVRDDYAYLAEADEEFEHFTDLDGWAMEELASVFVNFSGDANHRNGADLGSASPEGNAGSFADDLGY